MICPVTEPMYYGPGSVPLVDIPQGRNVYLPRGSDWYDLWTGERHNGGQTRWAAAPLERIPVFVRAGTMLPLGGVVEHSGQDPFGPLEIRV